MNPERPLRRYVRDRPCPACGCGPTPSKFCTKQTPGGDSYRGFDQHPWLPEGAHLHRVCLNCGHDRIELAHYTPLMAAATAHRIVREWQLERHCLLMELMRL